MSEVPMYGVGVSSVLGMSGYQVTHRESVFRKDYRGTWLTRSKLPP